MGADVRLTLFDWAFGVMLIATVVATALYWGALAGLVYVGLLYVAYRLGKMRQRRRPNPTSEGQSHAESGEPK